MLQIETSFFGSATPILDYIFILILSKKRTEAAMRTSYVGAKKKPHSFGDEDD